MKTKTEYLNNLKKNIITADMLSDALYSVNKRAKNYRDKARLYRNWEYGSYVYYENAVSKKQEFYAKKEKLLSIVKPTCIHKEFKGYERVRIYDYYCEEYEQAIKGLLGEIVYENEYYDREEEDFVQFVDVELKDCPIYSYYLYYNINNTHTFHSPIEESEVKGWVEKGLVVQEISTLKTKGADIQELVSCQFVDKVIKLIESGKYTYVSSSEHEIER